MRQRSVISLVPSNIRVGLRTFRHFQGRISTVPIHELHIFGSYYEGPYYRTLSLDCSLGRVSPFSQENLRSYAHVYRPRTPLCSGLCELDWSGPLKAPLAA